MAFKLDPMSQNPTKNYMDIQIQKIPESDKLVKLRNKYLSDSADQLI